jgi:hypothetical protein
MNSILRHGHYVEMEMKRWDSPEAGRFLSLRRWLHRRLGLVAWYKYTSEYGESSTRPFLALLLVLLTFTSLFPVAGLQHAPGKGPMQRESRPSSPI